MAKKKKEENKIKAWLNTRSGRVDISTSIIAVITIVLLNIYSGDIKAQIYISFFFISSFAATVGISIVELYRKYQKKKSKKPTNAFEFAFFICLFFSTLFATLMTQYSGRIETTDQFMNYLQFNWLWMFSFGLAFVFGFYHYIEKTDV